MELEDLKKKRKEFLDDTWKYYAEDVSRRAVEEDDTKLYEGMESKCRYKTMDGRKCAIGRHIPDDAYNPYMEGKNIEGGLLNKIIPAEILDLGIEFLQEVQLLHDCDDNWNILGLSSLGKHNLTRIEDLYCQ